MAISGGLLTQRQTDTTPAAPGDGYGRFYPKTDDLPYFQDEDGAEHLLAFGGAGSFTNISLTGTGGDGYAEILAQSSAPSSPATTGMRLYANAAGYLSWRENVSTDTFTRSLIGVLSANRSYTLPDYDGTFATLTGSETLTNKTLTTPVITGASITGDVSNSATGYLAVASGTTAQRPGSPANGMIRYNSDTSRMEFYAAAGWRNMVRLDGDSMTGNLTITLVTEQQRWAYDVSNYATLTISSAGNATFTTTGGTTTFGAAFTNPIATVNGVNTNASHTPTSGNAIAVRGNQSLLTITPGGFTLSGNQVAYNGNVSVAGASGGSITTATVFRATNSLNSTGATVSTINFYSAAATTAAAGTYASAVGVNLGAITLATNNTYLLAGTTTAPSGNWVIHSTSTNDSALAGNLRIGSTTAPTVPLDVSGAGFFTGASDTTQLTVKGFSAQTSDKQQWQTSAGVVTVAVGPTTIASGASATLRTLYVSSHTVTLTGSTNITTAAGFNLVDIGQSTLSAASALTITNAATVYIANAPTGGGAGPATITNAYALWVGAGNVAMAGNVRIGSSVAPTVALDVTGAGKFSTSLNVTSTITATSSVTSSRGTSAVGGASIVGVLVSGSTSATSGTTTRMSPSVYWQARAWDTAASQTVDFYAEVQPVSAATPTGSLVFSYSLNSAAASVVMTLTSAGKLGLSTTAPTAYLHLPAGSTAAATAPIKLTTGTSMTSAEVGAIEYTTDDLFFTISTSTARKRFLFADPVGGLTSGRVPYNTTNGRLTDQSTFTFDGTTLTSPKLAVTAGSGSGVSKIGGVIFDHFVDAGNTTVLGADDTLYTDTIPASTLATNADKIMAEYGGVFVSSATATREIKIWFGGTAVFDTGALTLSLSAAWTAYATIIRVSATVIRYMVSFTTEGAALAAYTAVGELTGLTLSNTNVLKITGAANAVGAAANDIVAKLGTISYQPAA